MNGNGIRLRTAQDCGRHRKVNSIEESGWQIVHESVITHILLPPDKYEVVVQEKVAKLGHATAPFSSVGIIDGQLTRFISTFHHPANFKFLRVGFSGFSSSRFEFK